MKKVIFALFAFVVGLGAADAAFTSCGAGYILSSHNKIDGINAAQCEKLWCRDLETGKAMGSGKSANSGYRSTSAPMELCDAKGTCVECYGDRKWCSGEVAGIWNPEYGAYTRGGADNATYQSYQKGGCFAWRLERPNCPAGESAVLQGDEWVCVVSSGTSEGSRASSVRRTGTLRRSLR